MLRVAVDCRHIQYHKEGITRTTIQTLRLLNKEIEFHVLLSDPTIKIPDLDNIDGIQRHYFGPALSKLDWVWENIGLRRCLRRINPDIYHAPCNLGLPLIRLPGIKHIASVHDLLVSYFPSSYPFLGRIKWHAGIRFLVRSADRIITGSEYTSLLLQHHFAINPDKISVVYNPLDPIFRNNTTQNVDSRDILDRYNLTGEYLMYHGGFRNYKDVPRVISLFNKLSPIRPGLKLCLAGTTNAHFARNIEPCIANSPYRSHIVSTGYLSDSELSALLRKASCFVYLSKMEGFGYPPLEAMACGVPVICSRNSSMIETLRDAPIWVEADETPDSVALKVRNVLSDIGLRAGMVSQGLTRAALFTADRFKNGILDVYNNAIEPNCGELQC